MFFYTALLDITGMYLFDKYEVNGTLQMPLNNITQPFTAKIINSKQLGFVSYYDNLSYTVWNNDSYHVFTQNDTHNCTKQINGGINLGLTTMLPNLSKGNNWTRENNAYIRGLNVSHYRLYARNGDQPIENGTYTFLVEDFQDYYCVPGNEFNNQELCIPWRWEIHGHNTNGGSHNSFYQIDYEEFDHIPSWADDIFVAPEVCKGVKATTASDLKAGATSPFGAVTDSDMVQNARAVYEINANRNMTFKTSVNRFAGMPFEHFLNTYTGYREQKPKQNQTYASPVSANFVPPQDFDLRTKGVSTPVKDQAICGSCWTFGAAGAIEGRLNYYLLQNKKQPLVRISEQQILSCTWLDKDGLQNLGCNGGEHNYAVDILVEKFGGRIPLESQSPYLGYEGKCDNTTFSGTYGQIKKSVLISKNDTLENRVLQMKLALMSGSVAVGTAVPKSFAYYSGGVYNDPACGYGKDANRVHSVTVIGWGTDQDYGEYWIVKNSWSNAWGMDGYIYISMNNDLCGILESQPMYVELIDPHPDNYEFTGTLSLPYANISQQLRVVRDINTQQQKISWYNDTDYQVWDLKSEGTKYFGVLTYMPAVGNTSKKYCTHVPQLGLNASELLDILPNLTQFELLDDTTIMGQQVRHYRLEQNDSGFPVEPRLSQTTFGSVRTDQQNFYCKKVYSICIPVRWEFFGYNSLFGSHYDYYVLDFDQFKVNPVINPQEFKELKDCGKDDAAQQQIQSDGKLSGRWMSLLQQPDAKTKYDNLQMILAHNSNASKSYTMAPNRYLGLSFQQFKQLHMGYKPYQKYNPKNAVKYPFPAIIDKNGQFYVNDNNVSTLFSRHLDWRVKGGVAPVRDQAHCGSCWAFGVAAAIEERVNIRYLGQHNRPLFQMSEQAIVDCLWSKGFPNDISQGLHGCDGGFADEAMDRIIDDYQGKLPQLSEYPYMGQNMECNVSAWSFGSVILESFSSTDPDHVGQLKYAIMQGPVTVAIAVTESMVFYSGGVFDDPKCENNFDKLNHQVVVVGWGVTHDTQQEYWIIRNSWSNAWGVDGYIHIAIKDGICGVTQATTIPNLAVKQ